MKNSRKNLIIGFSLTFLIIVFSVCTKLMWDILTIKQEAAVTKSVLLDYKWHHIENFLRELMYENAVLSENIARHIIEESRRFTEDELNDYLYSIHSIESNILRDILNDSINGISFRSIPGDWNDPFILIVGRQRENDSFVIADNSGENFPGESYYLEDGLIRYTKDDFQYFANPDSARHAMNQIFDYRSGELWEQVIFFQFLEAEPGAAEFISFDDRGIRQAFFDNDGDLKKTFSAIEILSPYYIYRDADIVGNPRILNRRITDARIIVVVSAFNPYDVMINDPSFYRNMNFLAHDINRQVNDMSNTQHTLIMSNILLFCIYFLGIIILYFLLMKSKERKE